MPGAGACTVDREWGGGRTGRNCRCCQGLWTRGCLLEGGRSEGSSSLLVVGEQVRRKKQQWLMKILDALSLNYFHDVLEAARKRERRTEDRFGSALLSPRLSWVTASSPSPSPSLWVTLCLSRCWCQLLSEHLHPGLASGSLFRLFSQFIQQVWFSMCVTTWKALT